MSDRQQGSVGGDARRRLRDHAGLLASGLAHLAVLLGVVLVGSPRLFATTPPQTIVVDIVRPEEIAKGELHETAPTKQTETQPQQQAQTQPQAQQQPQPQQQQAQQQQARVQQQPSPQPSPVKVASAAPVFTSLYPWPVGQPGGDVKEGDYRTFESMGKLEHNELARFKARLKECWHPPVVTASGRKLSAALRIAFRIDGSLAGQPELVEVSASPDAIALVTSAKQALAECGPYNFLPADSYDTWKALSLTFSPEDIAVAAVTK